MNDNVFFSLPLNTVGRTVCSPDISAVEEGVYIRIAMPRRVHSNESTRFSDMYHSTPHSIPFCLSYRMQRPYSKEFMQFQAVDMNSGVLHSGYFISKNPSPIKEEPILASPPVEMDFTGCYCSNEYTLNLAYYIDLPLISARYSVSVVSNDVHSNRLEFELMCDGKAVTCERRS